jgi:hypothetical protein
MGYMNKHRFGIMFTDIQEVMYSATVSRMSASWRDNEDKPLELTTYMGLFVDDRGFTGMTIYDWDGPKMKDPVWMFQGIPMSLEVWIKRTSMWIGEEKTLDLIEDIRGHKKYESGFTEFYQADRPR